MFDELTRENIEGHVVREIGRATARGARVAVVEIGGQRAVLKDIRRVGCLFRLTIGRWLLAREFRIYRALDRVDGVPRALRMIDRDGFLVEYIDGSYLRRRDIRKGALVAAEVYERCVALVSELHRRGVLHFDLRNRKNFVFGSGGRVHVVDFASAVRLPRWLPFRRRLIAWLGVFDRTGVLKMKRLLSPELMTAGETAALKRFERVRRFLLPHRRIRGALRRAKRDKIRRQGKERDN